jgi:hypothetical protein
MTRVDPETGEVITTAAVAVYDPKQYLAQLTANDGISHQRQLAAAYDSAVSALIGPNDVQIEGARSFKKKSAWRKLGRYFGISVELVKVERDELANGHFLATVTARAVAPWGQRYEEVGACCTDEATGRRVITIADAIATASTRASNRAISNLIAMGEVSAEEIGDRPAHSDAPRRGTSAPAKASGGVPVMAFGKTKGTALNLLPDSEVQSAIDWAVSKGKFVEFVDEARSYLANKNDTRADQPPPMEEEEWENLSDSVPF